MQANNLPTNRSTSQPSRQEANQPTKQSNNQPTNQPASQYVNKPTSKRTIQPTIQSDNSQSANRHANHPTKKPANQTTSQLINEPSIAKANPYPKVWHEIDYFGTIINTEILTLTILWTGTRQLWRIKEETISYSSRARSTTTMPRSSEKDDVQTTMTLCLYYHLDTWDQNMKELCLSLTSDGTVLINHNRQFSSFRLIWTP